MPSIGFYLNDVLPAISPEPLYAHASRMGFDTSHWAGRANSFSRVEGRDHSEGYVLIRWKELAAVNLDSEVSLTIRQKPLAGEQGAESQITFGRLRIKSAKAIYSNGSTTDDTLFLVHLVDRRYVFRMSPHVNRTYNVPSPSPTSTDPTEPGFYDVESLNDGQVWTWDDMMLDLWSRLPDAPTSPSFPTAPAGSPYNLDFRGQSAWQAIWAVYDDQRVGMNVNPQNGSPSLFQRGVTQSELAAAKNQNKSFGVSAYQVKTSVATNVPSSIKVTFSKVYIGAGVANEIAREGNHIQNCIHTETVPTGVAGTIPGTVLTVHDDLQAVVNVDGTILNQGEIEGRAIEKAEQIASALQKQAPQRMSYIGYRSDFVTGSEIKRVIYSDLGTSAGLTTEIVQKSSDAIEEDSPLDIGNVMLQLQNTPAPVTSTPTKSQALFASNQIGYPHNAHLVMIWEEGALDGDLVDRDEYGFWPGKIIRADPDQDFFDNSPYIQGDDCWIAATNLFIASTNSNAKLCQGAIYLAKVNGVVTVPTDDTRPLFLLVREQNDIWHCSAMGAIAAGATADVTLPDGRTVAATNWSNDVPITSGMKITVFFDQTNSQYYAIAAKISNAEIYACTVGSPSIAPNATGYVITRSGSTIQPARNWSNTKVIYGDKVVCWKDSADDQYYFLKGGGGLRWFKALTNGPTDSEGSPISISLVRALDGGPVPAISSIANPHRLAALGAKEVTFCEDYSGEVLEYRLMQAEHVNQRTIVDLKYDATLNSLMYKYRDCAVLSNEEVSGWQTFAVCTQTDIVTNVAVVSDDIKITKSTVVVLEQGTPVTTNLISFTNKTFVKEVTYDGTDLSMVQFDAKVWTPTTETPDVIATTSDQVVVYDVEDQGTQIYEHKIELTVWGVAEAAGETLVTVEECE